jgi:2,3-bisphosphoglycerate-dependent phosphoglycerate mutase
MTTRLLVARHGAAVYETDTVTDAGGSLSAEGRAQSRELGERLAAYDVAHVFASSMSRATQTAELAARVLDVEVSVRDGLREYSVGDLEGAPCEPDPIAPIYAEWVAGDMSVRIPGAESGTEGVERFEGVLAEAVAGPATALVVSHGAVICTALSMLARNLTPQQVRGRLLAHCDPIEVERGGDGWRVVSWPGLI